MVHLLQNWKAVHCGNKHSTHVPRIPTAYFDECSRSSVYFMHTENSFTHAGQHVILSISSFHIAICRTAISNEAPRTSALPKQSSRQGCGIRFSLSFLEPSSLTRHQKLNTLFHLSVSVMSGNLIASDSGFALPTWPRKTPADIRQKDATGWSGRWAQKHGSLWSLNVSNTSELLCPLQADFCFHISPLRSAPGCGSVWLIGLFHSQWPRSDERAEGLIWWNKCIGRRPSNGSVM